ncbi:hypothetical protein H5410_035976 [Solanum commersonii]|uniref:DUF4283 domain-containing protein n=1 Tax=Solanum commersonii TaxID=4109 RepID=A0A9J5Y567_SOLCO|nr:hypothetical protein H5410_035976 [Solanum commersonii]
MRNREGLSYSISCRNNKWATREMNAAKIQQRGKKLVITDATTTNQNEILAKSVIGSLPEEVSEASLSEIRRWAASTWKHKHGINIYDLGHNRLLFEFPNKTAADHIVRGERFWKSHKFILTEEETELRNHLKWARMKVRGDGDSVPKSVELVHEGLTFKVPIWVEMPVRVVADSRTKIPQMTQQSDEGTVGIQDESLLGFTEVTGHVGSSFDPEILNWPAVSARVKARVAEVPLPTTSNKSDAVSSLGAYSLSCKFTGKNRDFTWCLTGIYAPNNRVEREEVWWELGSARGLFDGPWVVCGDFNTVRFPSEKRNCSRFTRAMYDLSDFIEDMSLQDPHLIGSKYTWRKGESYDVAARLDRFLFSEEWNEEFKNIKQTTLQKVTSDHTPILLQSGNWEPRRSYFKFENWWLQTEGFLDRVKMWWNSIVCEGRSDFILAFKLRALKDKLKEWAKTSNGNLAMQKQNILAKLAELEEIQDQRVLTEDETLSKAELLVDFESIAKCEEIAWRQRSRVNWLKQGDNNTKFFHRSANAHRRYNNIDELVVDGEATKNPEVITKEIEKFYQRLYTETEIWRPAEGCRADRRGPRGSIGELPTVYPACLCVIE